MKTPVSLAGICLCACTSLLLAQSAPAPSGDKPRVFITDSQSWEIAGYGGGTSAGGGSRMAGGARPQTAEIIKTFGERCPQVMVNNIQQKADYIVLLDHEGGKSFVRHKNKVAVFARVSGDSVVSKSTLSLGGSVQDACEAITKDWSEHGAAIRAATLAAAADTNTPAAAPQGVTVTSTSAAPPIVGTARLSVASVPDSADIEVDGTFVGNTPSDVQVAEGEHTIVLKKTGFKDWERKLKVSGGNNVHLNADLEKAAP
jgi:hypothetical protein